MATMSRTMFVRVNSEIKVDVFAGLAGEYQVVSINIGAGETRGLSECSREEAPEIKEVHLRSTGGERMCSRFRSIHDNQRCRPQPGRNRRDKPSFHRSSALR